MTQPTQQPLVISSETKEAAIKIERIIRPNLFLNNRQEPEEIIQLAISNATQELQRENEELKFKLGNCQCCSCDQNKCQQLTEYQEAAKELAEALDYWHGKRPLDSACDACKALTRYTNLTTKEKK